MSAPGAPLANLHGQILPLAEVTISALDRGFLFGDAVYEVLRVYAGKPWLEQEHFDRLARSLQAIRIAGVDLPRLRRRMHETIAAGSFQEATVYLQITRGSAPRSHAFPSGVTPLELLWVQEFRDPYTEARAQGARVLLQPDLRWQHCDIKSTNLLANVLALQTAREAGCVEAILFLSDGHLTEASHSSFCAVRDGVLITTADSNAILPGTTRGLVLRLARQGGVTIEQRMLHRDELPRIQELFLAGTTTEVLPIVRVDEQVIGSGQPGPVTRNLQQAYRQAVQAFLDARSGNPG